MPSGHLLCRRAFATFVDATILLASALLITAAVLSPLGALVLLQWLWLNLFVSTYDVPMLLQQARTSLQFSHSPLEALFADTVLAGYLLAAAHLILFWLYFAGFEASRLQATPGKRLLRLIVSGDEQHRASFAQTSLRYWVLVIPAFLILLTVRLGWLPVALVVVGGNLLATLFSRSRRTINDWLSRSIVRDAIVVDHAT